MKKLTRLAIIGGASTLALALSAPALAAFTPRLDVSVPNGLNASGKVKIHTAVGPTDDTTARLVVYSPIRFAANGGTAGIGHRHRRRERARRRPRRRHRPSTGRDRGSRADGHCPRQRRAGPAGAAGDRSAPARRRTPRTGSSSSPPRATRSSWRRSSTSQPAQSRRSARRRSRSACRRTTFRPARPAARRSGSSSSTRC